MGSRSRPIKTILGFDFGYKRIGVAVGQVVTHTANPLTVIKAEHGKPDWDEIKKLIEQWQPQALVVGLPLHLSGDELEITPAARKFGNRLHGRFGLPVFWEDERLSSHEAEEILREMVDLHPGAQLDSMAAKLILDTWLREYGKSEHEPNA